MPFESLLPSLLKGEIDLAISSLVITKQRAKYIPFSIAYSDSYARFITTDGKQYQNITKETLDNKRVGVLKGTVYTKFIKSLKLKKTDIIIFDNENKQMEALSKNQIDFVLTDNQTALWWAANLDNIVKIAGQPFAVGEGIGIAVSPKNTKYLPNINSAIKALKADNTMQSLHQRYFFH